jgi:hypothetical protein
MVRIDPFPGRVDVDVGIGKLRDVMKQLVPHLLSDPMSLCDRQIRSDLDRQLDHHPVPDPSSPDLIDAVHAGD